MSNLRTREHSAQEHCSLSLSNAVEDVSHYSPGNAQMDALKEKQQTLNALQNVLLDVERKSERAQQELRSKVREIILVEGDMEHLELQTKVLQDRCALIIKENVELQIRINEEEEHARMALAKFNFYRNKIEGHRAENQTGDLKELEEKRALVSMLRQRKEALKQDLENPNGNTVQIAKQEMEALKENIAVTKKVIAERREHLRKEYETQTQIKKDIEIQNRRYKTIVKHLHCQLSRAQAAHRQMCDDIYNMEKQLAELKRQLKSSQDSASEDSPPAIHGAAFSLFRHIGLLCLGRPYQGHLLPGNIAPRIVGAHKLLHHDTPPLHVEAPAETRDPYTGKSGMEDDR